MKRLILLLCAMLTGTGAFLMAQSNQQEKEGKQRIVIVKKSVDQGGDVVIEKIIGEGSETDRVLREMVFKEDDEDVSITVIRDFDTDVQGAKKERLFMVRSANGKKLEGMIESDADPVRFNTNDGIHVHTSLDYQGYHDVTLISKQDIDESGKNGEIENFFIWHGSEDRESSAGKTNCAALGVYVGAHGDDQGGLRISSLIGGGGAEEAGLQGGDYILAIDDQEVRGYPDLLEALSRYVPGEDVNVTFTRDGQEANTVVTLKSWNAMPSMANTWRARVTCAKKEVPLESGEADPKPVQEPPAVSTSLENRLQLEGFHVFPNPSEGKFRMQFNAEAAPLTVRVTDLSGKEVYRDRLNRFDGIYNDQIDLRKYGPGAYILSIEQDGRAFSEQIVVQ